MTSKWKTRLGFYSLYPGKVGFKSREPIERTHETAEAAMLYLNEAIVDAAKFDSPKTFYLIDPQGEELTFNAAYRTVFGEEPKMTRGGHTFYPRLKGARVSR